MKANLCNKCLGGQVEYSYEEIPAGYYYDKDGRQVFHPHAYRTYIQCKKCGMKYAIQTSFEPVSYDLMVEKWNKINPSMIIPKEEGACENCEHCMKINHDGIYAICNETRKIFKLWEDDTRTYKCDSWIKKDT